MYNLNEGFNNRNDHNQKTTQFDFHLFLSIRPGIILWPALNLLLLLTILKYNRQISIRFALTILLQTIYIINVFMNETSMIRYITSIIFRCTFYESLLGTIHGNTHFGMSDFL
jgi:hypothetical protein